MFLDRGQLLFRSRRSRFFGIVFGDRLGGRLGLDRFLKLAVGLFQLCHTATVGFVRIPQRCVTHFCITAPRMRETKRNGRGHVTMVKNVTPRSLNYRRNRHFVQLFRATAFGAGAAVPCAVHHHDERVFAGPGDWDPIVCVNANLTGPHALVEDADRSKEHGKDAPESPTPKHTATLRVRIFRCKTPKHAATAGPIPGCLAKAGRVLHPFILFARSQAR